jgi:hypothetical protein
MILKPAPVSTDRFSYNHVGRTYTAEASDLGREPFGRVYDDAADAGLTLVAPGGEWQIVCAIDEVNRDREGDIRYWRLKPVTPGAPAVTVVIFND